MKQVESAWLAGDSHFRTRGHLGWLVWGSIAQLAFDQAAALSLTGRADFVSGRAWRCFFWGRRLLPARFATLLLCPCRCTVNLRLQSLHCRSGRFPSVSVRRTPLEIVRLLWQYGHFGFLPRFMLVTSSHLRPRAFIRSCPAPRLPLRSVVHWAAPPLWARHRRRIRVWRHHPANTRMLAEARSMPWATR